MPYKYFIIFFIAFLFFKASSQPYTHSDSLKGVYSDKRNWWNVLHYELHADFNADSTISGYNILTFKVLKPYKQLQLDLMEPMKIDSIFYETALCDYVKDGDAYFVKFNKEPPLNSIQKLRVVFHGKPRQAKNPPWDGGVVWTKDTKDNPWISIACQGMAARVWFPNKDHMADEPDSVDLFLSYSKDMPVVANGRLKTIEVKNNRLVFNWKVKNPINNYNIIPYIGRYVNIKDTFNGKNGVLDVNYWVLFNNYEKAKQHFAQVKSMLRCFEDWFGPYPFYEDGYQLVEAPFLGMEHQSAIAYGNDYQMGYLGRDLSQTGWGLKWDFIIVHESGHEWFGNNISASDVADNWIHESFTAYSENLYVEYLYGKKAGAEYVIGTRAAILNDAPMIADYHVNRSGSGDVYYKGANLLHTIRQIVNNDSLWKALLRGLNKTFWHQTVTTAQIENYMSAFLKLDLKKIFDQYLRTNQVPVLEYKMQNGKLHYRWTNCIKKFNLCVDVTNSNSTQRLYPSTKWKKIKVENTEPVFDKNYYLRTNKVIP